jgi:pyridinium-3,5-biscarboxylic acid mononucleotide sulfurtransferase
MTRPAGISIADLDPAMSLLTGSLRSPAPNAPKHIIGSMAATSHIASPGAESAQNEAETAQAPGAEATAKLRALETRLAGLTNLMVAYSGGVDSAFLAATAHRVLGERMLAVLADSASLARRDMEQARAFAESIGMPLRVVQTDELDRPEYARNDADRCFHCKDELFGVMGSLGSQLEFTNIAYGMNADDTRDFRPGQRAARDHAVLAPLADVGLTKAEIRSLARAAGYTLWDRPAAPCLSSRVEYGRTVTREVLEQIEKAEESMRQLGFREMRVRHHGKVARVEIARHELPRALSMEMFDAIHAALRQAGFQYVTLDCAGFRSGSLNAILPAEVLARRRA